MAPEQLHLCAGASTNPWPRSNKVAEIGSKVRPPVHTRPTFGDGNIDFAGCNDAGYCKRSRRLRQRGLDDRHLAAGHFADSLWCGEPSGAIGLGKLHHAAGLGWPLHREQVAAERCEIAVPLHRPCPHRLASRLLEAAEIEEWSVSTEACLLLE